MKICRICKINKNISEMVINHTTPVKIHYKDICKKCSGAKSKLVNQLRKENPYPGADYLCPICNQQADKYYLDHSWSTGKFRGWLCNACNIALGLLKDDVDNFKSAILYLKSN